MLADCNDPNVSALDKYVLDKIFLIQYSLYMENLTNFANSKIQ